jgi:hypothetical protein
MIIAADVDFWGVKCSGSENAHAIQKKICQKKLNFMHKCCKINVKAAENQNFPAFIFRFPAGTIL